MEVNLKTKMNAFCSTNQIQLLPARTPTIQGLVERSNRTFKENMRNLIIIAYVVFKFPNGASTQCKHPAS